MNLTNIWGIWVMSEITAKESWETTRLEKVSKINRGLSWSKSQENKDFKEGSVPVLRIGNVQERLDLKDTLFINQVTPQEFSKYKLTIDNIVMVGSNGNHNRIGNCCIIDKEMDFIYASFLIGIIPKKGLVEPKFLYYQISSQTIQKKIFDSITGTTGLANLSLDFMRNVSLLLPRSFKEQQKIASILENVDNNIDKTQEIIEKYEMMKQGLMHDLFTKGIDENGKPHTEFKDSELGEIPTSWDEIRFKNSITKILDFRGKTPKKIGMDWGGGEITALSANNVQMGKINFEKETYYASEELYDKWMNRGNCEFKDIIMTMEAPLGNIAQIPDNRKYILSQRVILLKTNKNKIQNDYLAHYLRSSFFQDQLSKYSSGTTAKGIQQSQLLKLKILIPNSISEQFRVSEKLNSIENKIESENKYLHKLQKLKTGLMQDLLTGKVRVKT